MPYLILTFTALIGATIHVLGNKRTMSTNKAFRIFLFWIIFFNVGVAGFMSFYAHMFMAEKVALYIGWVPGSPFQYEVAVANLILGVLGVMCIWFGDEFWLATIIASVIFGWGAGYVHIKDIMLNHNYAPGNTGSPLYCDLIGPLALIILFAIYKLTKKKRVLSKKVVVKKTIKKKTLKKKK
ncbi:MAG: DUF6790 family protein [bacterium]